MEKEMYAVIILIFLMVIVLTGSFDTFFEKNIAGSAISIETPPDSSNIKAIPEFLATLGLILGLIILTFYSGFIYVIKKGI